MSLVDYRTTLSWQGAIALGPKLVSLSEDLPLHEQTGLVMQLHELMVELPAMVATDLVNDSTQRFAPLYRLTAALELIERVYPALDGAEVRHELDELAVRLGGPDFAEQPAAPAPESNDESAPSEIPLAPADVPEPEPLATAPVEAAADVAHVPVTPADTAILAAEPAPTSATPQPPQVTSIHVQPDNL